MMQVFYRVGCAHNGLRQLKLHPQLQSAPPWQNLTRRLLRSPTTTRWHNATLRFTTKMLSCPMFDTPAPALQASLRRPTRPPLMSSTLIPCRAALSPKPHSPQPVMSRPLPEAVEAAAAPLVGASPWTCSSETSSSWTSTCAATGRV